MSKAVSIALLAVGVFLLVWGFNASQSAGSDISRIFSGAPTNKSIWLLLGGLVAAVLGLVGLLRGSKPA